MGVDPNKYELLYYTEYDPSKHEQDDECKYEEHVYIWICAETKLSFEDKLKEENQVHFSISYSKYKELESKYVGVLPETYKEFLNFLLRQKYDCMPKEREEWIDKLVSGDIVPDRFNQGDAFFSQPHIVEGVKLNQLISSTPTTKVGEEVNIPVMEQMLKT